MITDSEQARQSGAGVATLPVRLYGRRSCQKTRFYGEALHERNVAYAFRDVSDAAAAGELRRIFGGDPAGDKKFPTLLIHGKRLRNPSERDLDRALAHAGLYDPGVVHEPNAKRFVRYMLPRDAFVSYSEHNDAIVLSHIEVPREKRGSGLGKTFALEVFPRVKALGKPTRITCPFLRKVAADNDEWAHHFGI